MLAVRDDNVQVPQLLTCSCLGPTFLSPSFPPEASHQFFSHPAVLWGVRSRTRSSLLVLREEVREKDDYSSLLCIVKQSRTQVS